MSEIELQNIGLEFVLYRNKSFSLREWLLNSIAFPGRPESGFFDPVSDPANRSLYVSLAGRSIVRLSPIPPPEINPPSVIDLLEFAAIVEA